MVTSIQILTEKERIHDPMDISTYLCPMDEIVDDSEEDLLESIIDGYTEGDKDRETKEELNL